MLELPPREWIIDHLAAARWFPGTGEEFTLERVDPIAQWSEVGDPLPIVTLLATVKRSCGDTEVYQVFATRNDAGEWRDGTGDPGALAVLWRTFLSRNGLDQVRFHVDYPQLPHDLAPRRFAGQQSNTSVRFGDVAMAKFFRRLEHGSNPDIRIHRLLSTDRHVATLYGSMDAQWGAASGQSHADLMMVTELLTGARDGWELAVDAASAGVDFSAHSAAIAHAITAVHQRLAELGPTEHKPTAVVRQAFIDRLAGAVGEVPELTEMAAQIEQIYRDAPDTTITTQFIHGDFHLGQTIYCDPELNGDGSWRLIDFEGEPLRSLQQRSAPDFPLRDVAGLLRSIDYAARHAADPQWGPTARDSFLNAYGAEIDLRWLRAYEADKAVYEAVYEKRHRPDWLDIPLGALSRLTTGKQ